MRPVTFATASLLIGVLAACSAPGTEPPTESTTNATVFEGARLIVGDGSDPIEDSVFVVEGDRFTQVGPRGQVEVPEGAALVDLAGRTVMPAIVDTHTHLSDSREELIDQLQHKA
jgi:imidazolonepropionase-like amidohydrolase